MLYFKCSHCGDKLSVQDKLNGKWVTCPSCRTKTRAPKVKFDELEVVEEEKAATSKPQRPKLNKKPPREEYEEKPAWPLPVEPFLLILACLVLIVFLSFAITALSPRIGLVCRVCGILLLCAAQIWFAIIYWQNEFNIRTDAKEFTDAKYLIGAIMRAMFLPILIPITYFDQAWRPLCLVVLGSLMFYVNWAILYGVAPELASPKMLYHNPFIHPPPPKDDSTIRYEPTPPLASVAAQSCRRGVWEWSAESDFRSLMIHLADDGARRPPGVRRRSPQPSFPRSACRCRQG